MNVVRSSQAGRSGVREFVATVPQIETVPSEREMIRSLRAELRQLEEALAAARQGREQELREARAEGRREGVEAAAHDHAVQARLLAGAAQDAVDEFTTRLAEIEGLAALLAQAALSKVFDRTDAQAELVISAIRRQMNELKRAAVVVIEVSPADFPSEEALAAGAAGAGGGYRLAVDPDLGPGGCVVKLRLGELDIGLGTQWAALSRLLGDMAAEGARP